MVSDQKRPGSNPSWWKAGGHVIPAEVTESVLNHISLTSAGVAGIYNRYKYDDEKRTALDAWDAKLQLLLST